VDRTNKYAYLALISIGGETSRRSACTASRELVLSDGSSGSGGLEGVGGSKFG
jgi:hypothetical protein